MRSFLLGLILLCVPGYALGQTAPGALSNEVVPLRYSLTLTIDPAQNQFHGHDEIAVTFRRPQKSVELNGLNLAVTSAAVRLAGGRTIPAAWRQTDASGRALLTFSEPVPAGTATLLFEYRAPFNLALAGLYKVKRDGAAYALTQFEAADARRMFPCFDNPGFKTPFAMVVNAPKDDVVIANTRVVSKNQTGGGMIHWVFADTPRLPTYLVFLGVGPFDVVNLGNVPPDAERKAPLPLRGIAAKGRGRELRTALAYTPKLVMALERYFGIGFPFDKLDMIAAPDFAAGAMENAGAITFREQFLLMNPRAPLAQRRASILVQAHELTHQWFGDLVTPAWWDDTWLNEAFATWMAPKVAQMVAPQFQFSRDTLHGALDVMAIDELASARRIRNPVLNAGDIENAFDGITYQKGAAVLAMFDDYLGDEAWRTAIHAYLIRFARGNASEKDFITAVAGSTGHPEITPAFHSFLDQPGIPDMSVTMRCAEHPALTVVQAMYAPIGRMVEDRLWQVPMCVSAPGLANSCRMVARTADLSLGTTCPAYAMPNAGGKGYYRFAYDTKGWDAMIKAAPDLDPADQLTLLANMRAALGSDQLDAGLLFKAITDLAPVAKWDLIEEMDSILHGIHMHMLKARDDSDYEAFVRRLFVPRLKALGLRARPGDTPETVMTRVALARILVEEGGDPETIAELAKAASSYVSSNGRNLDGLSPDLAELAMRAGVMAGGAPFGAKLLDGYRASNDDYFRRSVLYAVMGSDDPEFLDGVFNLALSAQMKIGDVRFIFRDAGNEPAARAALWTWYQAHYGALLQRISPAGMRVAPSLFADACSADATTALDKFFGPKRNAIPGLARPLALVEEQVGRCIALSNAKGKDVRTALQAAMRKQVH